ncbi:SMP-30/gluconolactonase/LRE family protein [Nocardioides sp. LMS-CY]|uniref:SMP-30/gluconolactonase/LRE family protein n=1 Tax=Nocardioides sp. (strain LMS-CY) TaxID=2840457 RepID=UPI001C007781|nr:SMP-30/gluconolactonase/LRE family protein [Nocardioides sp. LMS-CY]QWF23308.1 SMP-30/gluconolactonase/LRE family protein [Nocardioides sp. LMS-CY]
MKRTTIASTLLAATAVSTVGAAVGTATPALADQDRDHGRAASYLLTGDPVDAANPAGSKFEGIGADERRGRFYVSEVTGGEIHRGKVGTARTREWLAGHGTDGRFTARGITVDDRGRVYVAGGPNGIGDGGVDNGRPDLWVYSKEGKRLAALRTPGNDVFLNDVAIGPDGAAYFTDSNDAQIFRVAKGKQGWNVRLWADASNKITRETGFNLGGIVLTQDKKAFVVAQGNVGTLWRFAVKSGKVTRVKTGSADLVNADGLVLQGSRLTVVRNFSKQIATLRLSADGRQAKLIRQQATSPDRVLTTAKELRGQILYVDSKFDEQVASGPYEVVADPTR